MSKYLYLDKIQGVSDLKKLSVDELPRLAAEMRDYLVEICSKTGGHLGAALGTTDLTIALHYVLNTPKDKIVWDVSHQTYPHKILTGRKDRMSTLRQYQGISGFTDPKESEHDHFMVAHAGTAISSALGLACARDFRGGDEKIVAVVGDGGLTAGLTYEGLNNAGHLKKKMLIILNDNEMSIAKNVGAISHYLNKIITNPIYNRVRHDVENSLERFPRLKKMTRQTLEGVKHVLVPGVLFEELGFRYFGPVDGHDLKGLIETLENVLKLDEVSLLHVVTEKGKGYEFAEKHDERFHGVTPFDIRTGCKVSPQKTGAQTEEKISYTEIFANALLKLAKKDPQVIAITAAMPSGTGLNNFQKEFPNRFYDVGIAEQHAVTFAGALAKDGLKPVCAIYSTFLQRSQDQLIHDVALQNVGTVVAMDRAGLVGSDGPTHNGVFDISYLSHIPGAVIAAPKDEAEMERMLELGVNYKGVFALRYPRGSVVKNPDIKALNFVIGEGEMLHEGEDAVILTQGDLTGNALRAAEILAGQGARVAVCNTRFIKPLDHELLRRLSAQFKLWFTVEDHVLTGGFGSRVLEFLEQENISGVTVKRFALPDHFTEHGEREFLLDRYGLSAEKIASRVAAWVKKPSAQKVLY